MKKLSAGKIVGISAIVIVVLLVAGFAVLSILFPPKKIATMVISKVEAVLGRPVSIRKAGISLVPVFGISLGGVEIGNTTRPGFAADPFVKFDRLSISIDLMSLLKRRPEIRKIIINQPSVLLEIDSSGSFNFDDLAVMNKDTTLKAQKPEKKSGLPMLPVPVSLQLFRIIDGKFTYRDARSGRDIVIDDLDDRIVFSIDRRLNDITTSGDLSLAKVSVKTADLKKPLSDLVVTLHHEIGADLVAGNADIKALRLSFQKVFLNLSGKVTDLNTVPQLDLALNSDTIALADLLKEVPVELVPVLAQLKAAGNLTLGLELKGALEQGKPFPVKGSLGIDQGNVQYSGLPKSINRIKAACTFTENSLDLSTLQMYFGENPVALKAKIVNFKKPHLDLRVRAKLNLGESRDLVRLPPGTALSGTVDADITAQGEADPSDPSKLDVKGTLGLGNVSVLWPPLVKPAVINGSFSLSTVAIGERLSFVIGRSSMKMNAAIKNYLSMVLPDSTRPLPRPAIDFTITAPLLDIDEFMPPEEKKEKTEPTPKKQAGPMIAPLPGVDTRGKITAASVLYKKIPMKNVTILVNVVNDRADIDIRSGFAGGTIAENIKADLRNTSNISFTNRLSVANVEIGDLLGHFGGFLPPATTINREINNLQKSLFGKIHLSSEFSGSGGTQDEITRTLKGDASFRMAQGRIANSLIVNRLSGAVEKFVKIDDITFRELATTLRVENGNVLVRNLGIQSNAGDWDAKGKVGFDASLGLDLSDRLTRPMSDQVLKVQSGGKSILKGLVKNTQFARAAGALMENVGIPTDNQGRITLKFALTGTASDPKVSFTGFGEGTVKAPQQQQKSLKEQAAKKVQDAVNEKKAAAQQRLNEEREKAQQAVEQKTQEQKKVIEQQKSTIEQNLKKNAAKKLKKLF